MAEDNVSDITLAAGERAFLIETLAATGSVIRTRKKYKQLYGHNISAKAIQTIQVKYKDQISKRRSEYLSDDCIKDCPLSYRRVRLSILEEVIEQGLEEKVVSVYKEKDETTGEETQKLITKVDLHSVLLALKASREEILGFEKLELDKKKVAQAQLEEEEEETYEVDSAV